MTYHRRNKKTLNKKIIIIVIVLFALFFLGSEIKGVIQWFSNPIITTKNLIVSPFKSSAEYFKFKKNLVDENESLKKENRRLEIENLTVSSLKKENQSLKEIVGYKEQQKEFVVAQVINQPPFSPYDTFTIDLGNDYTEISDKVYYSGVMIGEIEEIYSRTSVVRLLSSPEKVLFIKISENDTEASGLGGGGFVASLPKDIEINSGETVFIGETPIGKVDEIVSDQTGAFKNIYFRYPFNINNIDFVQVSKN